MSEIATAPTAPAPVAPVVPSTFAEAGAMLKDKDTWGDVGAPTPVDPNAVDAAVAAAADATKPEGTQPTADAPAPDAMAGFSVDTEGKLHRPDGTFASAEEITTWNAGAEAAPPVVPTAESAPTQPIVVTLRDRNGADVEIEVADEGAAEILRANHNEGMRGAEYRKRMAEVQAKEEEFRAFEQMVTTNPEDMILQHLPEDKQDALLVSLLARRWDKIAPKLVEFDNDPNARAAEVINTSRRIDQQKATLSSKQQAANYGKEMFTAASALIPEHVDDATQQRFVMDASRDIADAIQKNGGNPIPVEQVKTILAPRLALYGFDRGATPPPTPKRPVARSVSAATQPTAPTPKNPGAQVRRTVTAQRIAAATPPQGAGAATVRAPLVPSNSTIEQASQALRKQQGWGR